MNSQNGKFDYNQVELLDSIAGLLTRYEDKLSKKGTRIEVDVLGKPQDGTVAIVLVHQNVRMGRVSTNSTKEINIGEYDEIVECLTQEINRAFDRKDI